MYCSYILRLKWMKGMSQISSLKEEVISGLDELIKEEVISGLDELIKEEVISGLDELMFEADLTLVTKLNGDVLSFRSCSLSASEFLYR
jgi:hypothetical protein